VTSVPYHLGRAVAPAAGEEHALRCASDQTGA
jgi:hypothetical protein